MFASEYLSSGLFDQLEENPIAGIQKQSIWILMTFFCDLVFLPYERYVPIIVFNAVVCNHQPETKKNKQTKSSTCILWLFNAITMAPIRKEDVNLFHSGARKSEYFVRSGKEWWPTVLSQQPYQLWVGKNCAHTTDTAAITTESFVLITPSTPLSLFYSFVEWKLVEHAAIFCCLRYWHFETPVTLAHVETARKLHF